MKFSNVLQDVIEEDNGLILRLAAYEEMVGSREEKPGWTRRLITVLIERSRMIFGIQRADGAIERRN